MMRQTSHHPHPPEPCKLCKQVVATCRSHEEVPGGGRCARCRQDLVASLMPRSTSMQENPAGPLMPQPSAVHPAPGRENGNKRDDYQYDNNDVDQAVGPTMWGWESRHTDEKRDHCCRSDLPLPPPPTPPTPATLTFLGGEMSANDAIDKEYWDPPHPPGLVAIRWRSERSQTTSLVG